MNLVRKVLGLKPSPTETETPAEIAQQKAKAGGNTVQLAAPRLYSKPASRMRYGVRSHIGGRENNEDAAMALLISAELTGNPPAVGLFIIADGMGGHQHGERASALTVRIMSQTIITHILIPHVENRESNSDQNTIPEILTEAISDANTAVREEVPGGGNTVTCVVVRGDTAYVAHVGDSRAYLYDEGDLEQITRDHSMVERMRELGKSDDLPMRNVLYKAVGAGDKLDADSITRRMAPSSKLLICSDGLWDVLGDDRIKEILQLSNDPQLSCDQMIAAANELQGEDNITAVIIQMPD